MKASYPHLFITTLETINTRFSKESDQILLVFLTCLQNHNSITNKYFHLRIFGQHYYCALAVAMFRCWQGINIEQYINRIFQIVKHSTNFYLAMINIFNGQHFFPDHELSGLEEIPQSAIPRERKREGRDRIPSSNMVFLNIIYLLSTDHAMKCN